ncbi:MAG TPA: SDR family oxidoreductase [Limnobacter sp.]|nr:SDR family oxidoreductase [Limnobacter sp.]
MKKENRIKAIVTGHSKGLGLGISRALLHRGHAVLGLSRNSHASLLQEFPGLMQECRIDLADSAALHSAQFQATVAEFSREATQLFLVNNAGMVAPVGPLSAQSLPSIQTAVQLNIAAPLLLSALLVQQLEPQQQLGILHVSSGAGRSAYPGWAVYCATKAALDMHATAVQQDGLSNVRICSLAPGVIDTDMQADIRNVDKGLFPNKARFVQLKQENQLTDPGKAGEKLVDYLLGRHFGRAAVDDLRQHG